MTVNGTTPDAFANRFRVRDAYTGFEYAQADLILLAEDPRVVHDPAAPS